MSCDLGIHKLTKQVLNDRPWFGYKEGDSIIKILDSPKKKINQDTSVGVAKSVAQTLNKIINDGYKNVGQVYYQIFLDGRGAVQIAPTNKQLDLINAENQKEIEKLQKQVDFENKKKAFDARKNEGNWEVNEEGDIVVPEQDLSEQYPEVSETMKLIEKHCR